MNSVIKEYLRIVKPALVYCVNKCLILSALSVSSFRCFRFAFYTLPSPLWSVPSLRSFEGAFEARPHQSAEPAPPSLPSWKPRGRPQVRVGRLIHDTAETTERLKHTWRHETGRAVCVRVCVCVCVCACVCMCVCGCTLCGLNVGIKTH